MEEILFSRNIGYINLDLQKKLKELHLLIAGCGVGSQLTLAAARLGVGKLTLVDGDTVDLSNLNRQTFLHTHLKQNKSSALKEQILLINPEVEVISYDEYLNENNIDSIFKGVQIVFDTIDFLDIKAIVNLHDKANDLKIPVLSAFSAGWGACLIYCPPKENDISYIRKIFGIGTKELLPMDSYTKIFFSLLF